MVLLSTIWWGGRRSGNRIRCGRPHGAAPTADTGTVSICVGEPLGAPAGGCACRRSPSSVTALPCHLPPWRGKACRRPGVPSLRCLADKRSGASRRPRPTREAPERAGKGTSSYGVIHTGSVGSAKPGAEIEPHQRQFLQTQGPVARREFRVSLRFCAPEMKHRLPGGRLS